MPSDIATAVIAGGSAVAGGLIVGISNYAVSRKQAKDGHKAQLRNALESLLHCVGLIDQQLRSEPVPGRAATAVNEQMARRFPLLDYAIGRVHQRLFEPHLQALAESMHKAMAATILIVPLDLMPVLGEVNDLMTQAENRDAQWFEDWTAARGRLVVAARVALDEPVGRRPSPAENRLRRGVAGSVRPSSPPPPALPAGFPQLKLGPGFGQWWRIHGQANGPWWFSSSDDPPRPAGQIGRFDLPKPDGTCYVAAYLDAAAAESLRQPGVSDAEAQAAANTRRLSQMSLDRWHGQSIADFSSSAAKHFGAPDDIAALDRKDARAWALAAQRAGFRGILYRLREDPSSRLGLALFGPAGEHGPPGQPDPQPLPVGLRRELWDLFDGDYRGDPLLK